MLHSQNMWMGVQKGSKKNIMLNFCRLLQNADFSKYLAGDGFLLFFSDKIEHNFLEVNFSIDKHLSALIT